MIVIEKLHNIVQKLNMDDENEEKCYGHYESYGKTDHKNEHNIREYDISGW